MCCRWNADESTMNRNPTPDSIDLAREPDFALGPLHVRPSLRQVSGNGQAEMLEPRVMQVLVAFARQRGEVVSRDRLVERCWGGRAVGEDALNRCVARIRRLSEARGGFTIETIARVGYRLAEVASADAIAVEAAAVDGGVADRGVSERRSSPPAAAALAAASVPDAAMAADAAVAPQAPAVTEIAAIPRPRTGAPRSRGLVIGASIATLLVVAVGLAAIFTRPRTLSEAPANRPAVQIPHTKPRLAVLPFQNLSSDPANAFFADAMHAEILSALAMRGAALEVVPRTTMITYRDTPQPLAKVAADLAATHVLEGSLRREGDSVRLTVQLVDARTQAYVWSHTFDRKLVSALTLQSEVAGEIVSQLAVAVAPPPSATAAPTASPEAYDSYLRAKLLLEDEEWEQAGVLLDRAIALDPSFGAAYAARAESHHFTIVDNIDDTEQRLRLERNDIDAARRLLGEAAPSVLFLEAVYLDLEAADHKLPIQRMEAAEAAGFSDSSSVRQKASLLMLDDRLDESIVMLQSLAARDPGNMLILTNLAAELGLAHRPVEALRLRKFIMDQSPSMVVHLLQGRLIFGFTGRTDAWRTAVDQHAGALTTTAAIYRTHWDLLRFEGRYAELKRLLDSVSVRSLRGSAITSGGFALCCVGNRPTAEYRGWADLLNADAKAAAREGSAVLDFVAHEPPTRWNKWFLRTLAAEGLLLTGNKVQATIAAREALTLMPRKLDSLRSRYASAVAARVLAWAGAEDEAVTLLEQLAILRPGLGPAEIARDPLYFIPLARNARYEALVARLAIEMENYDGLIKAVTDTQRVSARPLTR
jgi:TolB-like protein/DNA-binding winged helix-turn-helix (wHTH) protein/tetratricopeptide (TPR) repeat protein